MSENTVQPFQTIIYFISKVFILIGMVLVFSLGSLGLGIVLSKYIFGVDALQNQSILSEFETNIYVLRSLKFMQSLNTIGGFLLPAFLFSKALHYQPSSFIGYEAKPNIKTILIAIGIMLVSMPLIADLIHRNEAYVFPASLADMEHKFRDMQASSEQLTKAFVKADGIGELLLNMVVVALLPAICEEFFFRGAVMRFLMLVMRNKHTVIGFTAIIFSMMHGDFYGLLPRFVLGMFLGYLAWYSGSIWSSVIAHFLNNGIALLSFYYSWNKSGIAFLDEAYVFPIYAVIISAACTIGLIYLLKKTSQVETYGA